MIDAAVEDRVYNSIDGLRMGAAFMGTDHSAITASIYLGAERALAHGPRSIAAAGDRDELLEPHERNRWAILVTTGMNGVNIRPLSMTINHL